MGVRQLFYAHITTQNWQMLRKDTPFSVPYVLQCPPCGLHECLVYIHSSSLLFSLKISCEARVHCSSLPP